MSEQPTCPGCGKPHAPHKVVLSFPDAKPMTMLPVHPLQTAVAQALQGLTVTIHTPKSTVQIKQVDQRQLPWDDRVLEGVGDPLTAAEVRNRWKEDLRRPHHYGCRRAAAAHDWLDYVSCPQCEVTLSEEDVFWQRPGGGGKERKGKRR